MPSVDAVRPPDCLPQASDQRSGLMVVRRPQREHDELVAADPCDGVGRSDDRFEAPRDRAKHLVARLVAADVVDALEPVEVDHE